MRNRSEPKAAEIDPAALAYLDYFQQNINCHHYALKYDADELITKTMVEEAKDFPPLAYAVAGFAAYHKSLTKPDGRVSDFLGFYTTAVKLLRLSFERKQKQTIATLLTILQLASIEVCLYLIMRDDFN